MLDERDRRIIEILSKNARVPYSEIAKELGISDVAVLKRIRKLEARGVIKGYVARVDPSAIGLGAHSVTGIDVEPDKLFKVIEELKSIPEIKYLALATGDHMIIAIIYAQDAEKLASIHKRIEEIDGVRSVWPSVILQEFKKEDGLVY